MKVGDRVRERYRPYNSGIVVRIDSHPAAEVVIDVQRDDGNLFTCFQYDDLDVIA